MHELAVTQGILEISLRHAQKTGAKRIVGINLVIGQLASVVDDSVQFYWDIVSKDTPAQGAKLLFERIPAELQCMDCSHRFPPGASTFECPNCSGMNVRVNKGEEFRVDSIDVE